MPAEAQLLAEEFLLPVFVRGIRFFCSQERTGKKKYENNGAPVNIGLRPRTALMRLAQLDLVLQSRISVCRYDGRAVVEGLAWQKESEIA